MTAQPEERPFTPERLAERWECSPQHITTLCRGGTLRAFKLGPKLWRIPAAEVRRWEDGATIRSGSDATEAGSVPSSAPDAAASASLLARQIRASRGPVLLSSSNSATD